MWDSPIRKPFDTRIFSKELLTSFHDGPVTFNAEGNVVYYSRNIDVDSQQRDLFDSQNQLGLFSAKLEGGSLGGHSVISL